MNSFSSRSSLQVGNRTYQMFSLNALTKSGLSLESLPYSLRILLENLLRHEDGRSVTEADIDFVAKVGCECPAISRNRIQPSAGTDAGLYRCTRGGRSRSHA